MSEIPPPPSYPPPPPSYPPPGPAGEEPQQPTLVASLGPEQPRRSRTPVIVLAVLGVLVVGLLAVAVPMVVDSGPSEQVAADLGDVRSYDGLAVTHTPEDVDYPQSPAVGGEHAPVWLDCGVYDAPVREENAVHDLEHGAVWISYDPDLDDDEVAALADALPQNGIMAPYPGLRAPVVVTVWGRQLDLTGAHDERLQLFIDTYGGGETAPEPFASCAGGVTDPGGDPDSGSGTEV